MKDKQRSRHEDTPTNKLSYLPLSPPSHQKSPQDSHYQSSSSPVGRPPPMLQQPYLFSNQDNESECDKMNAFLLASQEGEPSSSSSSASTSSSSNINHCFNTLNAYPMDFELYDLLGGNPGDMDDDSMSFTSDDNSLFPTLPNNNTTREA
ncbi:hypothetical protein MBANPS3_003338 [Mucor bainieri]